MGKVCFIPGDCFFLPSFTAKLPRGAYWVTPRTLAGLEEAGGRGEAKLLTPIKCKLAREGKGVLQVQSLSKSYENVAVLHVPLKREVRRYKSTEEIAKDNIFKEKYTTAEAAWTGTASTRPRRVKKEKFQAVRKPTQVGSCF